MKRLLIRPGAIGDCILAFPAMEALRAEYTEVWCPAPVTRLILWADRVLSLAASGIDRVAILECAEVIKRLQEFDEIHSWYGTNRPEFRAFVASHSLPFHFYPSLPESDDMHASDFFLTQVNAPLGQFPNVRTVSPEKHRLAVLHPFSGGMRKNWPIAYWNELARKLQPAVQVRWCCGPEDQYAGAVVIPDLRELAGWLAVASVFVGNDSGITHLAAAVGTRTVALFGPTNPAVWAPRGPNVTVIDRPSLADIDANTVAEAVL